VIGLCLPYPIWLETLNIAHYVAALFVGQQRGHFGSVEEILGWGEHLAAMLVLPTAGAPGVRRQLRFSSFWDTPIPFLDNYLS
jgi:hypothetical protein